LLERRCLPSTVTNLNDSGTGSLRDAIASGGTVDFQPGLSGTITLTTGSLEISENLSIEGPGAGVITVSGNKQFEVFRIDSSVTASILGLTIANGFSGDFAGGIGNLGTLTVINSVISGNSTGDRGGGIYNKEGTLTVINTTIWGNCAELFGGGIYNSGAIVINNCAINNNCTLSLKSSVGEDSGDGGGIYNEHQLTVSNSTLSENSAVGDGGGIYNPHGELAVSNCTFYRNVAGGSGGGIHSSAKLSINNSTLSGNSAEDGGGIYNYSGDFGSELTVGNCTLSGNSADENGGGIYNGSQLTVNDSTLSGNSAGSSGGGIANFSGPSDLSARDCIIAANTAGSGPDVYGGLNSLGHNLIGNISEGSGFVTSDILNANPLLGPLQDNGGPTQTMELLPGSQAIDTGDLALLNTPDQRGVLRTGGVNIGAYQASASSFRMSELPPSLIAGTTISFTLIAIDPYGNRATSYRGTVHFSSSDGNAVLSFTAADNGVYTFAATFKTAGTQSLIATDMLISSITSTPLTITINPAAASQLMLMGPTYDVTAGKPFSFTIRALDPYRNQATGYRGTVNFKSSDSQADLPKEDYTFTAADNGEHIFTAVNGLRVIFKTAGTQSLTVKDSNNSNVAGNFPITIIPGPPMSLMIFPDSFTVVAGNPLSFIVEAMDLYANIATSYRATVHFSSSDGKAVLSDDYTFAAADNGLHRFQATFKTAGTKSLTVTDAMFTATAFVTVAHAAPNQPVLLLFPSFTVAGTRVMFGVTAIDAYGNLAPGDTFLVTSSDKAVLPSEITTPDNGIVVVFKTAGTQSLTVKDSNNSNVAGNFPITIIPGPPMSLMIFPDSFTVVAGNPLSFIVEAMDLFANIATSYRGTVHFSSSDGKAVLADGYTFAVADNGVYTFAATFKTAGTQSLTVTDAMFTAKATVAVAPAATSQPVPTQIVLLESGPPRAFTVQILTSQLQSSSGVLLATSSGSGTSQSPPPPLLSGEFELIAPLELITSELPLPFFAYTDIREMISSSAMNIASGLASLLTETREQVPELLPQEESPLVPVATLIPSSRMDLPTGRRIVLGESLSSSTFLLSPEPPFRDELKPISRPPEGLVLPNRAIETEPRGRGREYETGAESHPRNPEQSSPTLLDLLIPKPSDESDELPVHGKNFSERIPGTRNESSFGSGDCSAEILRTKHGGKTSKLSGRLSGAIFALAVIQAFWSDVQANRQTRSVTSDKL
jgi:predicted outer membrane repeat protein